MNSAQTHGKWPVAFQKLSGAIRYERFPAPVKTFAGEDGGGILPLTLFMTVLFLTVAGLGIDTMRHEMERTRIQAALDRAVLAGAAARNSVEARNIVEDYFDKAGMASYLHDEADDDISSSLTSAKVTASASKTVDTYLMKLSGVETLTAAGTSTAEVNIPKLEAILVLDVSGSMAQNSKMQNLQAAAKDFVTTIMNSSETGNAVMSIVPFSFSVSPTEAMYNALAVDERHKYSTCLEFKDNDYTHSELTSGASAQSSGIPVNQMVYTSAYGNFDDLNRSWRSCYNDEYMRILPYSTSITDLHAKIDALQPDGNTSGNEGMNWGAALLDPTFRQVTASMISVGALSSSLSHVPEDYGSPDTLKAIIFMGDGENTTSYFFDRSNPKYRGKFSDLHEIVFQDRVFKYAYDIYNVDRRKYGSDGESQCNKPRWECVYETNGEAESVYYLRNPLTGSYWSISEEKWITSSEFGNLDTSIEGFISKTQLNWEIAWGLMSPNYYGNITGDWRPWNDYMGSEYVDGAKKNTLMQSVCSATKTEGVVVYSIGFEVPEGGTADTELRKCASSPAHYYRADGANINNAFSAIAGNVKQLRLTQ
ncbi:Flp pilus assembly protein TadG [Roseovarius azorensis]|uniref:Flp pilus assembly protein TadG n=1 Tax=Roseovarius azorensis TaxID=1287727 RepID=A0A1H7TUB1_9RHOB|nr:pilus assembly protein TadG-related protein [Roseovarius azorensis]SEL87497.1 Flp pilus assembly protein TadG [Roseovarius azorensis]